MKTVLNTVATIDRLAVINDNFQRIEDALNNEVLYRDNPVGEPNAMASDLDMNSQRIYNLPQPSLASEAARLQDVQDAIAGIVAANLIPFNPAAGVSATTMQGAIEEVAGDITAHIADATDAHAATAIGFLQAGVGATARTAQAKMRDVVSLLDFGAVGNGATDDTTVINAALSSGAKTIDGGGLTYATTAQVTVPEGVTFQNATIQMGNTNYLGVAYNSYSKILGITVLGTSRVNQYPSAQRGIGAASAGRSFVTVKARAELCNVNFDANGTSDSDIEVVVNNASGQTGISEGYGALFYQSASRNRIVCWATGNKRHGLYISSGSSDNDVTVFDRGTIDNFGVQINTSKDQPLCTGNVIRGSSYGSAGGVVVAQQSTDSADAGGGLQNNIIRDFEVVGVEVASGVNVANLYSAFLLSISQVGAQAASGNSFINCSARGVFNSTSLGILHIGGVLPKDSVVRDLNIKAVCKNTTTGALVLDNTGGITRLNGINIDLLTSAIGILGSYFSVPAASYFTFDDVQIVMPGATKVFYSGSSAAQRLGDGNTYNVTVPVTAVPATSSKTVNVNVPVHLQSSTVSTAIVSSQGTSTNNLSQVIVSANTGAVITFTVYNGHSVAQDITISVFISGLPA